ncbi:MAG TPA: hypothetical protein VEH29_00850 [Acidimicrobiales bacterium]|nr:hypothetical protein [Acidimicrobiales bacterium]
MTRRSVALLTVTAAVCALSGCGSRAAATRRTPPTSTTSAVTSTTSAVQEAAKTYLAAAGKVDQALRAFNDTVDSWSPTETGREAEPSAQPVITALRAFTSTLAGYAWPAGDLNDVLTLMSATGTLIGDLQGLAYVNAIKASQWPSQFSLDTQAVSVDANFLRHDLGLPPAG